MGLPRHDLPKATSAHSECTCSATLPTLVICVGALANLKDLALADWVLSCVRLIEGFAGDDSVDFCDKGYQTSFAQTTSGQVLTSENVLEGKLDVASV
jgi:hypothetical protein